LSSGVSRVIIGQAESLSQIITGEKGTALVHGDE
jgi:hypothetical protein